MRIRGHFDSGRHYNGLGVQSLKNKAFSVLLWLAAVSIAMPVAAQTSTPATKPAAAPVERAPHGAGDANAKPPTRPPAPADSKHAKTTESESVEITGNFAEIGRNGDIHAQGASIRQGMRELAADELEYEAATGRFRARGEVKYSDPDIVVGGTTGTFDRETGASISDASFELPADLMRGDAELITVQPGGFVSLQRARYTSCPEDDLDWVLKASTISLDTKGRNGVGRDVRVDFMGVPILYTPFISFPLGEARKSGFLYPDVGFSSRGGAEVSVPYYFNLAPNYDLTLAARFMSRRGVEVSQQLRYLTPRQHGTLEASYLPGDNLRGIDRSRIDWNHRADFARNWRVNITAANVGDSNYFEDFGLGSEDASIPYLERSAEFSHYGRHWTMLAQIQNFQTIDQAIPDPARPYSRLPRLRGRGAWNSARLGLDYTLDGEMVYFHRNSGPTSPVDVTGARLDVRPELSWSFRRPGLYITPAAAYRYTQYRLEDVAPGADDAPERASPMTSLDAGMIFERAQGSRGDRVQTLEPRLLYLYVPYREQSQLPVFDSGLPDLNIVQLFRRNRYVGADRLSDANQVSVGVTSRLLDADSGRQFLSATFGQTYYFDSPRVTLPGETPLIRDTSNFISQLSLTAYRDWNVNLGHEWNPEFSSSEKTELALQYRPTGGPAGGPAGAHPGSRVINAGYRFRSGLIEQVDASVAWPVAGRWNVFARGVYSLRDDTLIEQFAGFEYAACCWRLRLVQRRYVSDRTGERDSSIALQLELRGLGSVGLPDAFLERAIRGYSPGPDRQARRTP